MRGIRDPRLIPIAEKVMEGKRLSFEDGLVLYQTKDLPTLMRLANLVRERKHGHKTYFVHSIRVSQTNICYVGCTFCAFQRRFGEEGAWDWDVDEVVAWVKERYQPGLTEIHLTAGHHPKRPFAYYLDLVRALKENFPGVQVKAWTAAEIHHFSKIARLPYREVLKALKEAGLPPHAVGDGTSKSLLPLLPQGRGVAALQLYGKPLPLLENALAERGYRVLPLMPYRHLPDPEGILRLEEALLRGEVDALAFVAAIQVEFLFEGAKDPKALREALNTRVKALAVGRVTADALREWGVKPFYVDETERLGSLLQGFKRALQKEVA